MTTWNVIVGVDPSESSAGWCVLGARPGEEFGVFDSGQCKGAKVAEQVVAALPGNYVCLAIGIEGMFPGPALNKFVTPTTHWKLGFRTGCILTELQAGLSCRRHWIPQPNAWRDKIKIKRGRRDAVAKAMLVWATHFTGEEIRGPRGGAQVDRAMACGIAAATCLWLQDEITKTGGSGR